MWYLLYCDTDRSHSKVTESAVMNVGGSVEINDIVTFFYSNDSHLGKVLLIDENEEAIDAELRRLGKKARRVTKKIPANASGTEALPTKRVSKPTNKFSPSGSTGSNTTPTVPASTRKRKSNAKISAAKIAGASVMNEETAKTLKSPESVSVPDDLLHSDAESDEMPLNRKNKKWIKSVREKKGNLIDSSSESDKEFQPEDVPSDSNDATSLSKDATSPSKDALREQIRMLQEKLNSSKADNKDDNKEANEGEGEGDMPSSPDTSNQNKRSSLTAVKKTEGDMEVSGDENQSETIVVELPPDHTLFGKEYKGEEMVKLCNSTFCKKSVLSNALSNSNKVSHLVGKLIPGVFTKEAIMRATLTGKRPPAAGRSTAPVDQTGLHPTAVNDILLYAAEVRKRRSWVEQTPDILNRRMSQKVGELKRKWKEEDQKQKNKPAQVGNGTPAVAGPVEDGGGAADIAGGSSGAD